MFRQLCDREGLSPKFDEYMKEFGFHLDCAHDIN